MPPEPVDVVPLLSAAKVTVVAGKGGVGKTTVTALLARAAADAGRRVIAVELDGKPTLAELVGDVPLLALSAPLALEEYLREHGFGRVAKRLAASGMIDVVSTAAPGIDDLVVLGKIKQLERSGEWDTIVVDGPAAGHAVTMLTSAAGLRDAVTSGPVRAQADDVLEMLGDASRCQVALVTLPETTPVNETIDTAFTIEDRVGVKLAPVFVNAVDVDADADELPDDRRSARRGDRRARRRPISRRRAASRGAVPRRAPTRAAQSDRRPRQRPAARSSCTCRSSPAGSTEPPWPGSRGTCAAADPSASLRGPVDDRSGAATPCSRCSTRRPSSSAAGPEASARRRSPRPSASKRRVAAGASSSSRSTRRSVSPTPSASTTWVPSRAGSTLPASAESGGELWAMMLDTAAAFTAVVRRHAADPAQAERIVANTFFRNMAGSLSGTQEYMAAETLHLLAGDERFDLVVVDTPPTRSALDFLAAPGVLARFLDHRLFKLLMLPARPGMRMFNVATQPVLRTIGRVVGSDVLADAVAFFQAFAGMEAGFRQRADDVMTLLRAPSTVFLLVAAPRHEAVAEAAWFAGQLAEQGIDNVAGVANRVHPAFGESSADDAERAAADVDRGAAGAVAEPRRARPPPRVGAVDARRVPRPVRRRTVRRGAAAGVRRPRPRGTRPRRPPPLRRGRADEPFHYIAEACVCCWRWTSTGSSTTSSPPSGAPTRRSRCAATVAASASRSPPSPMTVGPTTWPSSICRSGRWAVSP